MSLVLAMLLTLSFIVFLGGLGTLLSDDDANIGCFMVIVGGLAAAGFWILMQ